MKAMVLWLEHANTALLELKERKIRGAKVLVVKKWIDALMIYNKGEPLFSTQRRSDAEEFLN